MRPSVPELDMRAFLFPKKTPNSNVYLFSYVTDTRRFLWKQKGAGTHG